MVRISEMSGLSGPVSDEHVRSVLIVLEVGDLEGPVKNGGGGEGNLENAPGCTNGSGR